MQSFVLCGSVELVFSKNCHKRTKRASLFRIIRTRMPSGCHGEQAIITTFNYTKTGGRQHMTDTSQGSPSRRAI